MRAKRRIFYKLLSAAVLVVITGCATSPVGENRPSRIPANASRDVAVSNLELARTEFGRGNYGSAIELLEKELSQKPASVAALNGLGACYDQLGRFDVAQRYYFRALDLAPESSQTLSNIGYSYLQQGRHREAVPVLELALQKNGSNQLAANNLELARSGLVSEVAPEQIARSTNNGSSADEIDFLSLLSLLQEAENAASTTALVSEGADSATGAEPAVSVVTSGSTPPVLARAQQPTAAEPVVELQPEAVIAEVDAPDQQSDDSPAALTRRVESTTAEVPPGEVPEPVESTASPASLTAVPPGESAALALVTETKAVVTPVLEPVSGEAPAASEPAADISPLTLTIIDTPQPDPARSSDLPPTLANLTQPLNLVIENGNGVRGIARATSNLLKGEKLDIKRIGDARNFDYARTVIYYRPELAPYAQEIASSLNLSCDLQPSTELAKGADVRVVLGHDFASQVSVENGDLSFEPLPNTSYLSATVRLEVTNGNGVNGMAARVREYLKSRGGNVVRIADADSYEYEHTLLYYRSGTRIAAEGLAASLPVVNIKLIESNNLRSETDARLIVGKDFIPFDNLVLN